MVLDDRTAAHMRQKFKYITRQKTVVMPGMLSRRGQRGLEAKIFGLGLVASGLGLTQCNAGLVLTKVVLVA